MPLGAKVSLVPFIANCKLSVFVLISTNEIYPWFHGHSQKGTPLHFKQINLTNSIEFQAEILSYYSKIYEGEIKILWLQLSLFRKLSFQKH